jgi:hypothetical protein
MTRVRYSLEQRVVIYDFYVKRKQTNHEGENFILNLNLDLSGDIISKLVKKVRTHGILINRTPLKRNRVLTEEKLGDIVRRLENSPRKSLRRLALQSDVSVGSAWIATKPLHIRPYKITFVPEIKAMDYEKRVRFCNWYSNDVHVGLLDPKLTFFTDRLILISRDMLIHKTTSI